MIRSKCNNNPMSTLHIDNQSITIIGYYLEVTWKVNQLYIQSTSWMYSAIVDEKLMCRLKCNPCVGEFCNVLVDLISSFYFYNRLHTPCRLGPPI